MGCEHPPVVTGVTYEGALVGGASSQPDCLQAHWEAGASHAVV